MTRCILAGAALVFAALAPALAVAAPSGVTLENSRFSLAISADGKVRSLKVKSTGEECIAGDEGVSFCQAVQDRPFGNEVKLIWPNKRSVYGSNSVEERDGALVFGFDTVSDSPGYSYKAIVDVKVTDDYMAFTLRGFEPDSMDEFMDWPAVAEFRVVQLPLRPRKNFGVVMNCAWDEKAAVALMAAAPEPHGGGAGGGDRQRSPCAMQADMGRHVRCRKVAWRPGCNRRRRGRGDTRPR